MSPLTIITAPDCHYCPLIKQYLTDLSVSFTELDISSLHLAWLKFRLRQEGKGIPALMYQNQIIVVGNRKPKALQALRDWGLLDGRGEMYS